ncbi:uncharacterized protein LOC125237863 [Leguminivora glycinivorella]|uniref:uncharacterized protein LOC125237863 n=1 Tax=Leguminivora glycinivorella TaxID=1035111 RepID=UPI00200D3F2A|nr:uncharacterized protein LOC125237863 [Leguminivora glycinivorella]
MIRANTNESRQPEFGSQDNRQARSRRLSIAPDALSEPEQSIPRARRFRAGFATRFFDQRLSCGSPSSVSTTSLAQLREKLKDLPPFVFNKNYTRIAASPDLPGLKEEHQERLSNSQPKPRCGATRLRQYNSDSETHNFSKNIRQLSPIAEDSPSVLSATLDETNSPDQPTFIEAFKELQPRVDLVNLLVEEALNHGQDKDSGIISGKVTQDSDIVENTPFVDTAPRKKLGLRRQSKNPEEVRYTTDDSDVVNDTPCYDDWRKRSRTKRGQVNKIKIDDNETLNEQAVDAYFCQRSSIHCVEFISPDTIKKISETLSRDDVREDDYNIVDGIEIIEKHDEIDFAFEADIVDCVNDVLDKVCSDLDKCVDLLTEQQHQLDIENRDIPNRTTSFLKMNKDSLKSLKDKTNDIDNEDVQKVTLKFKPKKRAPKKNTVRQKKAKCVKPSDNVEDEDPKESTKSPLVGDVDATEQLIRKKRKLYSPKDDDNENNEIPRSRKDRRPSSSTESPIAACYKELENARKSRIRLPRKKTSTQPVISPNTKKLNDIFDKIKDNVVNNEKVTLVDKKSDKDMSLYNLSSESEDEVFKKKRIQVQKRISSSSLESTTKRRRSVKPVNYASYYSSEDECQKTAKPVAVKQTKPRSRKVKRIQSTDLTDERMRAEPPEVLETSFVQEKGHSNVPEEPQPAVNVPLLETIPEDVHEELVNVSGSKPQPPNKQEIIKVKTENRFKKRCDKLSKPTKRIKDTPRNVPTERESTTVSPLPGLVVESEPRKDDLTSSLDANLLQKLKKIYTDVEDLSTTRDTQNMLLNENDNDGINVDAPLSINNSNDNSVAENIQPVDISDGGKEEKSIDTGGRSPITGHNDLNESPPNLDALNESFQHRDVDVEDRSRSITEFLVNMRNQVLNTKAVKSTSPVIPITRMSTKDSTRSIVNKTPQLKRKKSVASSYIESVTSNPSVVLKRISSEDIESRVNPVTPKSQYSASRVALTRMSSDKVQKFLTPTRSMKSSSTVTPVVVLKRVSSDEINKWLPLPETKDVIEKKREKIPKWQPIPEIKNVIKKNLK